MKKKKVIKRKYSHKVNTPQITESPFLRVQNLLIVAVCVLVLVAGVGFVNKRSITRSVEGARIMRGFFDQAIIPLPHLGKAVSYNIYYRQNTQDTFTLAVRNIPADASSYTISYLKKGTGYVYKISAVGSGGSEFWFSAVKPIIGIFAM